MIAQYKPNEKDKHIIDDITTKIGESLNAWYGEGTRLAAQEPKIRSYRNCFILRYPLTCSNGEKKMVLVKIRRNPKMDSLWRAVAANIHANIPTEYKSLEYVFSWLSGMKVDFGVIRPLAYFEKYYAIIMEEFPSRTLRQILVNQRSSKDGACMSELVDAATKTGKWLRYFHHHMYPPEETQYSTDDLLNVVQKYALRLEDYSRGRIKARSLLEAFSRKLKNVQIDTMLFSKSHADMTCDNVLYSDDKKVCVIDIKTRFAPIYSDLGLILTHPETFKLQIFSGGTYLPESILKKYRAAILAGYFGDEPQDEFLVQIYSAIKVLDKWTMYEELMSKYRGIKYLLAFPIGPIVTSYFQNVLKKHLDLIQTTEVRQVFRVAKPADAGEQKSSFQQQ